MNRTTARELAIHFSYELGLNGGTPEELLERRFGDMEYFDTRRSEDDLYANRPDEDSMQYIRRLVTGVSEHAPELDAYIEKYAIGWKFSRISLVASAIMRVAMYEVLYMDDIPDSAAMNEAVEIAKKYEPKETVSFINGLLGSFVRGEKA